MEEVMYGEHNFKIPSGIIQDSSYLLEIISPDTWNNILTDRHRQQLMKFLPDFPEDDLNEKTRTLEMFFMNENFFFGSPLQNFHGDLYKGFFNPNIAKQRRINKRILKKSYRYRQKQYYHRLLQDVVISRKNLIEGTRITGSLPDSIMPISKPLSHKMDRREICLQRTRKRYFRELRSIKTETGCESEMSEDENYPDGPGLILNKKQRRQLVLLESSFPSRLSLVRGTFSRGSLAMDLESRITASENPFDTSDEHLRHLIADYSIRRKKNSVTTAIRGITMLAVLERAQMYGKKPLQRSHLMSLPSQQLKSSVPSITKKSSLTRKKVKPILKEKLSYNFSAPPTLGRDLCMKSSSLVKKEISTDESSSDEETDNFDRIKTEEIEASKNLAEERSLFAPELTQETHISFFSLLRDVICSTPNQRMSKLQLENSIRTWQESAISPLNEWFSSLESWVGSLPSAINFLCGNLSLDIHSSDFVPFIEHKISSKCFQWIGAGRDTDSNLEPLCQFWLSNRNGITNVWPTTANVPIVEESKTPVSKNATSTWNVTPTVVTPDNEYHLQERLRYGSPHKAFTYRMKGYESVIGPVKGVYSQQAGSTSKAREHTLLVPSRPPFVTILSLVWDAVSRLPNGEGTKVDICKLVKESQFIIPISTPALENTLTNVVSGALDRLQNEKDPCVKFDTSRKLWVYLHNNRTEEEFERIHHMNGPLSGNKSKSLGSSRKSKAKKEEVDKGPPNVAMEQFSSAIKQMDGSEVRVKDEDLLKNWVKISTAPMKKNETVKITSSQLRADLAKMKAANAKAAAAESITENNASSSKSPQLAFKTPILQSVPTNVGKILGTQMLTHCEDVAAVTASSSNTTLQFAKRVNLVQSSVTSPVLTTSTVNAQCARKYQSASEKKRLAGVLPSASSSTAIVSSVSQPSKTSVSELTTVPGIKVLQFSSQNVQGIGKNVLGSTPIVMDAGSTIPTALVGQKLVVSGNRLLVHGGKVLQNVSGSSGGRGKQLITGILPSQQIVAVSTLKKGPAEHVEGEATGGRFIQIAAVDSGTSSGFQKVTLVPQYSQPSITSGEQKGIETLNFSSAVPGIKTTLASGELKLKLRGTTTFTTSSGNITGNLISLGGKQIFLATKGSATNKTNPQFHQMVVGDVGAARIENVKAVRRTVGSVQQLHISQNNQQTSVQSSSSGQPVFVSATTHSNQQHIIVPVSTSGQQIVVPTCGANQQIVVPTNAGGQQIMVPASALHGSQINLKGLQAFQSFKVVPASQLTQQQKGKPMVAHILTPSAQGNRSGATQLSLHISPDSHVRK